MNEIVQILAVVISMLIGYALGIHHSRQALREVLERINNAERKLGYDKETEDGRTDTGRT
jgi:hypothetical protein